MRNDPVDARPKRLTRAEARARTRALLLEAAAEVFAQRGFAGASVDAIAERAGFSIGAVYSNFGSKEGLFLELLGTRAVGRVSAAAHMVKSRRKDPGSQGGGLGQVLVGGADRDGLDASLRAEFWLYAVRNPHVMSTMADQLRDAYTALERLIEGVLKRRGAYNGQSVAPIATVIFALGQGLSQLRWIDGDRVSDELLDEALAWLFTGIAQAARDLS
jgi:AcrR family transcriptional regulator